MAVLLTTDIGIWHKTLYAMNSMNVSSSSKAASDPLSDALLVLGATVSRRTRLEASGDWALAFPAMDRLKFVAFLRGAAWIMLPGTAPERMTAGDVCLFGSTPYRLASDPGVESIDGSTLYDHADVVRIGGSDTIVLGGTVSFGVENASFLLDRLPDFLFVPRSSAASGAIATILALRDGELARSTIGGEIVSARLADLLLVEAIRAFSHGGAPVEIGWLGALSDRRLGRALYAIHGDVAQPWTVARLASIAGMSRAGFAAEFTRRVGQPPLAYVRTWRMTIARAALTRGDATISSIAGMVGYSSMSAFAFAFRSAFGVSPRAYARQ